MINTYFDEETRKVLEQSSSFMQIDEGLERNKNDDNILDKTLPLKNSEPSFIGTAFNQDSSPMLKQMDRQIS